MDSSKESPSVLSLCTGYGGLEQALEILYGGVRVLAYSEISAFACALLVSRMESGELDPAPIWTDLTTFPSVEFQDKVDILTGGFPCQPFSNAGSGLGEEDPRHLFPYILTIIEAVKPRVIFLENVDGITTAELNDGTPVLLHVLTQLELRDYSTTWVFSSAEAAGHRHNRVRVFILAVANAVCEGSQGQLWPVSDAERWQEEKRHLATTGLRVCGGGMEQHPWEEPRYADAYGNSFTQLGGTAYGVKGRPNPITERVERLILLGNGVVPQAAVLGYLDCLRRLGC